jgi:hypothetical protein
MLEDTSSPFFIDELVVSSAEIAPDCIAAYASHMSAGVVLDS